MPRYQSVPSGYIEKAPGEKTRKNSKSAVGVLSLVVLDTKFDSHNLGVAEMETRRTLLLALNFTLTIGRPLGVEDERALDEPCTLETRLKVCGPQASNASLRRGSGLC